jgi:Ca-activated chloride channel homolog
MQSGFPEHPGILKKFMKKIIFLIIPVIFLALAFKPDHMYTVSGKVTDEKGNPLNYISVSVKGSKSGTITNPDGLYRISVNKGTDVLVFSAVGYVQQEININSRLIVDAVLVQTSVTSTEVVVTALGVTRQPKMLGYSTAKIGVLRNSPDLTIRGYTTGTDKDFNTEGYDNIVENRFLKAVDNPLSTFSIDVDAASYSNVRRFLNSGKLPPAGAVRIEEMINYFHYEYPQPTEGQPFSVNTEISSAPWNKEHKLVLIGLQGKKLPAGDLPPSNFVFLIDVSGSMMSENKLPLVKASMKLLVDQLREQDKISMVVYAGAAGLVLPPTSGMQKTKIRDAIDQLEAGGSTAGGAGIKLAYKTARENFFRNGNNRVILCTDGDFNVGVSSDDDMVRLVEEERKSGVFLTVLGYGMGNYKDSKMQKLADKGNGNHAYIDNLSEARKVLVNEFGGTLFTIAKDVKLQVEFNPAKVQGYRLIGYENRMLAKEDFNDDKKDAGELGSGHTVTALYEIIPVGVKSDFLQTTDSLKYQTPMERFSESSYADEIMTVKFRYKAPDGETSKLFAHSVEDEIIAIKETSVNFRFAASVAEFGMLLRNSDFKGSASYENVLMLAARSKGKDDEGYRAEFIKLVKIARTFADQNKDPDDDDLSVLEND